MGPAPTVGLETATRPTAAVWHAATLGHDSAAASLLWMRAVVHFSTSESPDPEWIRAAVSTCADLDPRWASPSRYGALMLAALGDISGHESVLADAAVRWPDEPWFAAALGMSRWLRADDAEGAARWLAFAAATPGADPLLGRLAERLAAEAP